MKNYYDILEIHPESGQEVIELSYKSLYNHYNPENFNSPEEILQATIMRNQLKEAYEVLSKPKKRAKYDKYYKSKGGKVERQKIFGQALWIFIVLAILILAKWIADASFKYFARLTVIIAKNPVLETILFIITALILVSIIRNILKTKKVQEK